MAERIRSLGPYYEALEARALLVLRDDLTGLGPYRPPRLGSMRVSPVYNWGTPEGRANALHAQRARWSLTLSSGPPVGGNLFTAHYSFCLLDDPAAVEIIEQILAEEQYFQAEMPDFVAKATGLYTHD